MWLCWSDFHRAFGFFFVFFLLLGNRVEREHLLAQVREMNELKKDKRRIDLTIIAAHKKTL